MYNQKICITVQPDDGQYTGRKHEFYTQYTILCENTCVLTI
jgi:hypothetical protein